MKKRRRLEARGGVTRNRRTSAWLDAWNASAARRLPNLFDDDKGRHRARPGLGKKTNDEQMKDLRGTATG
eukprot:14967401-Heterocapsa_arctica.AAC.1